MGVFDRLLAEAPCPFCSSAQSWHLQYKYGACWQNDHRIGDAIPRAEKPRWDDHPPIPGRVRVAGIAEEACAGCGAKEIWAAITVDDDRITGVEFLKHVPREDDRGVIVELSNREDPLQVSGHIVNTRPSGTKPR